MGTDAGRTDRGRRAFAFGLRAESLAAGWLRLKGYRILARRFKRPVGEVDLIVRRGNLLAFVEVKGRGDLDIAARSLTPLQRRRVERAAQAFLAGRPDLSGVDLRFDLVLVRPGSRPRHLADAWRPEGGV